MSKDIMIITEGICHRILKYNVNNHIHCTFSFAPRDFGRRELFMYNGICESVKKHSLYYWH
jgi:hypothetical protein